MKKINLLFAFVLFLTTCGFTQAQVFNFTVSPQVQCYTGNNTAFAAITATSPGAVAYYWNVTGSSCSGSITSNPVSYSVGLSFPCCGVYTVFCNALSSNSTVINSAAQIVTITCGNSLSITSVPFAPICPGNSSTLIASGGTTYTWSNGATGSVIVVTPSVSTCYSVIASGSLCNSSAVRCVTLVSTPTANIFGPTAICAGNSAVLTASGALNYTWLPGGQTSYSISVNPTSTTCYTLIASNGAGCITTSSVKCLTVNPNPTVTVIGSGSCNNSPVTLVASGAATYSWFPANVTGSSVVISPSVSPCYTVVGVSSAGCPASTGSCISSGSANISISGNTVICAGGSTSLTATGLISYTWSTGSVFSSIIVSPTATTCYTISGSNASGCFGSKSICVYVSASPTVTTYNNGVFCAGSADTLYASGASSYTWLPYNLTGSSIIITPTAGGCYTVIGSNGNGCGTSSAVGCFSVLPSSGVSISGVNTICAGSSAALTATGMTNYYWYPGGLTGSAVVVSPSVSTCYTVYAYNGYCNSIAVHCLSVQPSSVYVAGLGTICAGNSTTLTAGGGVSYTWQPGNLTGSSIIVSPSVSTCYSVTSSGSSGCNSTVVKCVSVNARPNITTYANTICAGSVDTLYAYGAVTYSWLPYNLTGSSIIISPTAAACYTVSGTNANGCTNSTTNCFSVMPTPTLSISAPNSVCSGYSATLSASGASSYYWYPGGFSGSAVVVSPTVSTCYTVYAYNGMCSTSAVHCLSVQPSSVLISGISTICGGNSTTLSASGSTSYTWYPGNLTGANVVVSPSVSTCYTVIGANASGCSSSAVKCVTVSNQPVLTIAGSSTACPFTPVFLSASGASSYTWLPGGQNTPSINPTFSASGCYTLIGSNGPGCTSSAVKCVSVMPSPVINISGNGTVCAGNSTTLTASGANTYTWVNPNATGSVVVFTPTATTCYSVYGYNQYGCPTGTGGCVIVQASSPLTISGNTSVCAGNSTTLTLSGALGYTWYPSNATGSVMVLTPTATTCFSVIGTNGSGCNSYAGACVTVYQTPTISVGGNNSYCAGSSATLTVSGAASYTWMPGNISGPNAVISSSISNCYTVLASNGPGCNASAVKCVSVLPSPGIVISGNNFICSGQSASYLASGGVTYTWNTGSTSPLITVYPVSNVCYTVAATSAQGCVGMATKCVTVQSAPNITVSGNTHICRGMSTLLTASGASSYTWSTGSLFPSATVNPTTNTTYSVSGNNGACQGGTVVTVFVSPSPVIGVVSSSSVICAGQSATLTAVGAPSFTWSNGSLGSNIVVSPSVTSSYTVNGRDTSGCVGSAAIVQAVSPCTGIEQSSVKAPVFSVYPNPNNGVFNVIYSTYSDNARLTVYNSLGQMILNEDIVSDITTINLSDYSKGLYYIQIKQGENQSFLKVIKE